LDPVAAIQAHSLAETDDQPYPGLRSFRRDEAHIFFGREGTINSMVDRLAAHFLAVTGASGSGKSSLVRTGLLDGLDRGLLAEAGTHWTVIDFRPGNQPLAALAEALLKALEGQVDTEQAALIGARLARGPSALAGLLDDLGIPDQENILLLVDQFEETFRYQQNDEADAFVALLLASVAQRRRRIYGVITMRSDFFGECSRFPGLAEAINDSQFLAPRLTRAQLRAAIEGPASVYDGHVEPALVNQLLNDIGSNPDQLPLMQHVLMLMWQEARERDPAGEVVLTLRRYHELGGIVPEVAAQGSEPGLLPPPGGCGALSQHLDRLLHQLSPAQQRLAEVLFRTLVDSEGAISRDVRHPTPLRDIAAVAGVSVAELAPVVEEFRAPRHNFLTPAAPAPLLPDTVVDISHESLIRQWHTMRYWLQKEHDSATQYRRIETTAALEARGQEGLLHMPYLGVAEQWRARQQPNAAWASRYGGDYDRAVEFLDRSKQLLDRSMQRNRQKKIGAWLLVALLITSAGGFGGWKYYQATAALAALKEELLKGRLLPSLDRMHARNELLADEADTYGVPPQDTLQPNLGSKTPTTIPRGQVVLLRDLRALYDGPAPPLLIDAWVLNGPRHAQTTAIRIPFAGNPGSFDDDVQARLMERLGNLTDGDRARKLVFFCLGSQCWESYNAALRAIHGGYEHVYWFRGGNDAWTAGGNSWQATSDEADAITMRLSPESKSAPRRRWADAMTLEVVAEVIAEGTGNTGEASRVAKRAFDALQSLARSFEGDANFLRDVADSQRRLGYYYGISGSADLAMAAFQDELKTRQAAIAAQPADIDARRRYIVAVYRMGMYQKWARRGADAAATFETGRKAALPPDGGELKTIYGSDNPALWVRDVGRALEAASLPYALDKYLEAQRIDLARLHAAVDKDQAAADLWADESLIGKLHQNARVPDPDRALNTYRDAAEQLGRVVQGQSGLPMAKLDLVLAQKEAATIDQTQNKLVNAQRELTAALDAAGAAKAAGNAAADATITDLARELTGLAWKLELAGTYDRARDAAARAAAVLPDNRSVQINLAHALMFTGHTDDAPSIYLSHRGTRFDDHQLWDNVVVNDFGELRQQGHETPLMDEVEGKMAPDTQKP
jgi:rhodanese-related sulfurtransferase